jgi:hypothetical protein
MFVNAGAFNQDLNPWNIDAVTNFNSMFQSATGFGQALLVYSFWCYRS